MKAQANLNEGVQLPLTFQLISKVYLQRFCLHLGHMQDVLYHQGGHINPCLTADSITDELQNTYAPCALALQTKSTIKQNGSINLKGLGVLQQSYYIGIKYRNFIEIWIANPVLLQNNTSYDITISAIQANRSNQHEGKSSICDSPPGDIHQDDAIDAIDYLIQDPDFITGESGYFATDLNGDGIVDSFDYLILDVNLSNGVGALMP